MNYLQYLLITQENNTHRYPHDQDTLASWTKRIKSWATIRLNLQLSLKAELSEKLGLNIKLLKNPNKFITNTTTIWFNFFTKVTKCRLEPTYPQVSQFCRPLTKTNTSSMTRALYMSVRTIHTTLMSSNRMRLKLKKTTFLIWKNREKSDLRICTFRLRIIVCWRSSKLSSLWV